MRRIVISIIVLLFATACDDILEENPKAVAVNNFYRTASEIESAVYAAYDPIRTTVASTTGYWMVIAGIVDYGVGRASLTNLTDFQDPYSSTNIGRINSVWSGAYRSIRNANLVIENAPKSLEVSEEEIDKYVAEAKFMRAFCYFILVRNWGPLPLRTEENVLETDAPRMPENDVYSLIVSDLENAESYLPEKQDIVGRADKYAAKAMLSHVYLQMGRWQDARNKALEIIDSGRYSLVEVKTSDDYYKIFGPDVLNSTEEIFYLKYNLESGASIGAYRHHSSVPYWNYGGLYAKYTDSVSTKVIREWDYNDLRKSFNLYNANIGFGPTTMLFKKFIDPDVVGNDGKYDFPAYKYSDVLLIYAEADCRVNNGPTADGMEKLNMIHRRAYGQDINVNSPVDFNVNDYDKESFIDLVLQEGLYEQMDEGKRFLELKRTGKLIEIVKENTGLDVAEAHILWPIPSGEYDYNGAIDPTTDQNPGY